MNGGYQPTNTTGQHHSVSIPHIQCFKTWIYQMRMVDTWEFP